MRYSVFDQIEISGPPLGQLYRDRLELIRVLDDAGFTHYFKSEHHMIPLDSMPQIGLLFAAAAQSTRQIRLGSLVYLLPFHHPLRLAEEICSLDHMLDGRFDLGVGRGISLPEHEMWGLDTTRMIENYEESLAVLRAALTSDSLTFHGDTYHFDDVPIMLRPLQQPMPPMWHPGNFVQAARDRMNTVVVGPPPMVAEQVAKYRAECEAAGWSGGDVGGITNVIVAPTDEEAVALAPHLASLHRAPHAVVPQVGHPSAERSDARRRRRARAASRGDRRRLAIDGRRAARPVRRGRRHRPLRREVHDGRPHARRVDAFDRPVRKPCDGPLRMLALKLVIGTTRQGRAADIVTPWAIERREEPRCVDVEVPDLPDWPLPMFAEGIHSIGDINDPTYTEPIVRCRCAAPSSSATCSRRSRTAGHAMWSPTRR